MTEPSQTSPSARITNELHRAGGLVAQRNFRVLGSPVAHGIGIWAVLVLAERVAQEFLGIGECTSLGGIVIGSLVLFVGSALSTRASSRGKLLNVAVLSAFFVISLGVVLAWGGASIGGVLLLPVVATVPLFCGYRWGLRR